MEGVGTQVTRRWAGVSCGMLLFLAFLWRQANAEDHVVVLEPGKSLEQKWPNKVPMGMLTNGQTRNRFTGIESSPSISAVGGGGKRSLRSTEPEINAERTTDGIKYSAPSGVSGGTVYTVSYTAKFEVLHWQKVTRALSGAWISDRTYTKPMTTKVVVLLPATLQPVESRENGEMTLNLPSSVRVLKATPSSKRVEAAIDADKSSILLRATTEATTPVSIQYQLAGKTYRTRVVVRTKKEPGHSKAKDEAKSKVEGKVEDEGWVQLFNGGDLSGWKLHPQLNQQIVEMIPKLKDGRVVAYEGKRKDGTVASLWAIEDGLLVGRGPANYLFTAGGDYDNFEYRIEASISDGGEGGQCFRAAFAPQVRQGYEAQVNASHKDKIKTGSLYLPEVKEVLVLDTPPHKPDEWFTQSVTADGDRIIIHVNGKKTVDWRDPKAAYKKGHLALQALESGTVVKFRKIAVRKLGARLEAQPEAKPLISRLFPVGSTWTGKQIDADLGTEQNITCKVADVEGSVATVRMVNDRGDWDLKLEVRDGSINLRNCIGIRRHSGNQPFAEISNITLKGESGESALQGEVTLAGTWDWRHPTTRKGGKVQVRLELKRD